MESEQEVPHRRCFMYSELLYGGCSAKVFFALCLTPPASSISCAGQDISGLPCSPGFFVVWKGVRSRGWKGLIQSWSHQIQELRNSPWFCTWGIVNSWNKSLSWRFFSNFYFSCFEDSCKKAMHKNKIRMMLLPCSSLMSLHWFEKVLERPRPPHFSFLTSYFMKPFYQ